MNQSESSKRVREKRISLGLCPKCGRNKSMDGKSCEECKERQRVLWKNKGILEKQTKLKKMSQHAKKQRDEFMAMGLCKSCGKNKPSENKYICAVCAEKTQKKYNKRKQIGLCGNCGNKAILGQVRCEECRIKYVNRHKNTKLLALSYLGNRCVKCGRECTSDKFFMFDFHHRDPSKKDINLTVLLGRKTELTKEILLELDKCDILCVSCHRMRHGLDATKWENYDGKF